ncbi:GHKL domain-containing protein [Bacillus sp. JJ1533]|uniref:sensor histidine kinase n=1 Tax=Bacillus sp. JJ1533 TaxID=3122959 RepID=UPI002FFFCEDF
MLYWGIITVLAVLCLYLFLSRFTLSKKVKTLMEETKHFDEQRAQFNETFRVVRSERHDFLKHVSAVHFMLETEKHKEAKHYLDELVEGYKETNLSIKGERGVVAGILHQMYRKAKALDIEVVYDFDVPLSTLPLSDQQIVTLIGNLLSNSIDACEEWQNNHHKQAFLTVQFYKRSGLYILQCKNNSLPIPAKILDQLFVNYGKSTKGEGHEGLGTKLIHDVVKEANGFLDFVHKDEEFAIKIKIPAIRGK